MCMYGVCTPALVLVRVSSSLSIPEGLMKAINLAPPVSPTLPIRSKITAKAGETRPLERTIALENNGVIGYL